MSEFLIQVSALAQGSKNFKVTLKNYLNGQTIPIDTPMEVQPGDQIAWNLMVIAGGRVYQPAFQVDFFGANGAPDSSFFGKAAVTAPGGQTTPFAHVLALQEVIKYSIFADGFGKILDPKIQTGDGTSKYGQVPLGGLMPTYTVIWNYPGANMTYQAGHGSPQHFPADGLNVNLTDTVSFVASVTGDPPSQALDAVFAFDPAHFWISPFTQSQQDLPMSVSSNPTSMFEVVDRIDRPGAVFSFNAETEDGSIRSTSYHFILRD